MNNQNMNDPQIGPGPGNGYRPNDQLPKIKWKNVLILLAVIFGLIILPSIFIVFSALIQGITSFTAGLVNEFQQLTQTGVGQRAPAEESESLKLAKLCAILIFILAIIKIIVDRK